MRIIAMTNLAFAEWVKVFGGEKLITALLARLAHHATVTGALADVATYATDGLLSHRRPSFGAASGGRRRIGRLARLTSLRDTDTDWPEGFRSRHASTRRTSRIDG